MELTDLLNFFAAYGLPTLAISIVAAIVKLLSDKFLSEKVGAGLLSIIPFAVSVTLYFLYDWIFVKGTPYFGEETFSAGIIGVSASALISASFYRIKNGKIADGNNVIKLIVEGILRDYVKADFLSVATAVVENILEKALETEYYDENVLLEEITNVIKKYSADKISYEEMKTAARLTVQAVKKIKNE